MKRRTTRKYYHLIVGTGIIAKGYSVDELQISIERIYLKAFA
jgi:hypothetical protein